MLSHVVGSLARDHKHTMPLSKSDSYIFSRLPHLAAWTEDFTVSWNGELDDNFEQFHKVYAALNPDRAQVPPEYLEEFKQRRAVDCPDFWQIEEARACEACDVVPPPPPDPLALSAPPSGSRSEQAASTAAVRAADGAL